MSRWPFLEPSYGPKFCLPKLVDYLPKHIAAMRGSIDPLIARIKQIVERENRQSQIAVSSNDMLTSYKESWRDYCKIDCGAKHKMWAMPSHGRPQSSDASTKPQPAY